MIFFVYLVLFLRKEENSKYGIYSELTFVILLRNVRVFHYCVENESVKVIAETSRHVTKPVLGQFLFIYIVYYSYAQIGGIWFGGDLTYLTYEASGAPDLYFLMNFNDFGCALVTLFHMMIVNNWFITVDMYATIEGNNWVRLFFFSFWVILVLIMFNIFIAIILEIHSSVSEIVSKQEHQTSVKKQLREILKGHSDEQIREKIEEARRIIQEEEAKLDSKL